MSMTLSLIPDSAPFNPEQRAWLNGFLAGWLGLNGESGDGQGNGAAIAQSAAALMNPGLAAPEARSKVEPAPLPQPEAEPWHDPALSIDDRLKLAEGKPLGSRLMAAMAQLDCGSCGYLCKTYGEAIAQGTETSLALCSPGGSETARALKRIIKEKVASDGNGNGNGVVHTNGHAKTVTNGWSRANPFQARLIRSVCLNKPGSEKETRHVEIDLSGGPSYQVGDSLGVCPENCDALVNDVLEALGASGEEQVAPVSGSETSLRDALAHRRCLTTVPEELLVLLAEAATDPSE